MSPPAILAAEETGTSEVVTAGIAGRILNPRSPDWELKDRCDYSSSLTENAHVGREGRTHWPLLGQSTFVRGEGSGGRFGTAQSTFQVGGNTGSAIGPLLAAAIIIPHGQAAVAWFVLIAAPAVFVVWRLSQWSVTHGQTKLKSLAQNQAVGLSKGILRSSQHRQPDLC